MGADARQRGHLQQLLATTEVWETWTGLDDVSERAARITWPAYPGEDQLPAIVLAVGASERIAYPPGAGKSGFRATGSLAVLVFDAVDQEVDYRTDDDRVTGLVSDLMDQLVAHPDIAAGRTRMRIRRAYFEPGWLTQTILNTADDSDDPGEADFVGRVWKGMFFIDWGPFR
ncbi:MAG: hypothetical protein ABJZ55_20425 [Fuerstiella sp.]